MNLIPSIISVHTFILLSFYTFTFISNSPFNNTIVKIGDEYKVLNLKDNLPLANKFYQNSLDIRMEVYYESIYGDKWKLTLDTLGPRTIEIPKEFELLEEDQFLN